MTKWKEYKLGDIAELRSEKFTPNEITSYPYIGLEHIEPKSLRLNGIGTSNDVSSQKSVFYPNDTLYGKLRPYFQKVYSPCFKGVCSTDIFVVKPKKGIHSKFLFYILASDEFTNLANSGSTGTRMPRADWKHLSTTIWNLPDLTTQTAIAEILSSLDDKIELNNKMNQELENLAQTLFKQWFIDFEFPDENGNPYKSSGGEMVDSELGEIPKGFSVETLSEQTELIRGISYSKPELVSKEDGVPFVNLKCFALNGTFRQDGLKYYNGKYKDKHILQNNDILVAVTDLTQDRVIIGLPILWAADALALPSLDVCVVRSESVTLKNYLYYEFKSFRYKSRIIEYANGSTVLHLSVKGLETYQFPTPPVSILTNWSNFINPILEQINANINETQELSHLRDTLLPKLISGELEVSDVSLYL